MYYLNNIFCVLHNNIKKDSTCLKNVSKQTLKMSTSEL